MVTVGGPGATIKLVFWSTIRWGFDVVLFKSAGPKKNTSTNPQLQK